MMRDYLEPMLGATGALIAQFAITLAVLLILILIVFWLIRRFSNGRFGGGSSKGRQPRLAIVDALPVDSRRRLILVRRDNVEHLILIGGPSDVVVEASVLRAPPQGRRLEPQRNAPPPQQPVRAEPARPVPEPRRPEPPLAQFEPEPVSRTFPPAPAMTEIASTETFFATVAQSEAAMEPMPVPAPAPEPRQAAQARRSSAIPSFISSVRGRQTPIVPRDVPAPERPRSDPRQDARQESRQESRQEARQESRQDLPRVALRPEEIPRPAVRPEPIETRRVGPRSRPIEATRPPIEMPAPAVPTGEAEIGPRPGESDLLTPDAPRPAVIKQNPLMSASARQTGPAPAGGLASLPDDFPPYEPIFAIDNDDRPSIERPDPAMTHPAFIDEAPVVNPPMPQDELSSNQGEERIEPVLPREPEPDESPVGDLEREMARLLGEISSTRK